MANINAGIGRAVLSIHGEGDRAAELTHHLVEIDEALEKLRASISRLKVSTSRDEAEDAVSDIGEELSHLIWHVGDCSSLRHYLERHADWRGDDLA